MTDGDLHPAVGRSRMTALTFVEVHGSDAFRRLRAGEIVPGQTWRSRLLFRKSGGVSITMSN